MVATAVLIVLGILFITAERLVILIFRGVECLLDFPHPVARTGEYWPTPHAPVGLGPVLAHFYASNSGFAIRADGTVMAWGIYVGGDHEWALKPIPFYKVQLET